MRNLKGPPNIVFVAAILLLTPVIDAFSSTPGTPRAVLRTPVVRRICGSADPKRKFLFSLFVALDNDKSTVFYQPIFNFTNPSENAVSKFERIDDAIMGGISLSSIKQLPNESFARWSGICRTDGGGFCGTRTLPFEAPLKVGSDAGGLYLLYRFTSDDEPDRRVWKMTTRSEDSRGERLYQAMFEIPKPVIRENDEQQIEWQKVTIPFDSFAQVRGPRLVEGAPRLNATGGLYQIGISLSKFQMATNTTEIKDFRSGYFELQIKEIGVVNSRIGGNEDAIELVQTLSKEEMEKKRPVVLKVLIPITKLLFSEKRRRQQSAERILRKRGYSRWDIIRFGFKNRIARKGVAGAILDSMGLFLQSTLRTILGWSLRILVFYPVVWGLRLFKIITSPFKRRELQTTV